MYYFPEPPFFLLFIGFFVGITCGLAFEASLKERINHWRTQSKQKQKRELSGLSGLKFSFWGICVGICVFLAAGLEIFTYNRALSYSISLPLTIFIGGLIWSQLNKLIVQLLEGGSKALDLDTFY